MRNRSVSLEQLFDMWARILWLGRLCDKKETLVILKPLCFTTFTEKERDKVLEALGITLQDYENSEHLEIIFPTGDEATKAMEALDGKFRDTAYARLYVGGEFVRENHY